MQQPKWSGHKEINKKINCPCDPHAQAHRDTEFWHVAIARRIFERRCLYALWGLPALRMIVFADPILLYMHFDTLISRNSFQHGTTALANHKRHSHSFAQVTLGNATL